MSSTQASPPPEQPTTTASTSDEAASAPALPEVRRGLVTIEAALVVSMTVEVEVAPREGEDELELGRAAALRSVARKDWDLTSLAAARSLSRSLWGRGHVLKLQIARQVADDPAELLVDRSASSLEEQD